MVKEKMRICRLRDKLLTSTYNGGPDGVCWWTPKPPKQRNNQIDKGEPKRERSHGARQVRDHLSLALENSEPKKETLDTEE